MLLLYYHHHNIESISSSIPSSIMTILLYPADKYKFIYLSTTPSKQ